MKLGEWMTVEQVDWNPGDRRSTNIWQVFDRHGGILGEVRWNGAWRQYVFEPAPVPTTFSRGCLTDLAGFVSLQMRLWREEKIAKDDSR